MARFCALVLAAGVAVGTTPSVAVKVGLRTFADIDGQWTGFLGGFGIQREPAEGRLSSALLESDRLAWIHEHTGQLIDWPAQRVDTLRRAERAYVSRTVAETHRDVAIAQHRLAGTLRNLSDLFADSPTATPSQSRRRAARFEYDTDVAPTGARRSVAARDAAEVVVRVSARERGADDERPRWLATSRVWLGDRLPDVDALVAFQRRYFEAIFRGAIRGVFLNWVDTETASLLDEQLHEYTPVAAAVAAALDGLDGTVLAASTTFELLIPERRPLATLGFEYVSIDTAPTEKVRIPPGFTLKKRF